MYTNIPHNHNDYRGTMTKKSEIMIKYEYWMLEWKQTNDPKAAIEIIKMIENNSLGVKVKFDGELKFIAKSGFRNKCIICGTYYEKGDSCFLMDSKGWHVECGSQQDKQNPFYQKWAASNGIAQEPFKTISKIEPEAVAEEELTLTGTDDWDDRRM